MDDAVALSGIFFGSAARVGVKDSPVISKKTEAIEIIFFILNLR